MIIPFTNHENTIVIRNALLTIYKASESWHYTEGMETLESGLNQHLPPRSQWQVQSLIGRLERAHQFGNIQKMKECAAQLLPYFT